MTSEESARNRDEATRTDVAGHPLRFSLSLDGGEVVEVDGTTVADPESGEQSPALILRMSRGRAHALSQVLMNWSRIALSMDAVSEEVLARALGAGAAALGAPSAKEGAEPASGTVSVRQRIAAVVALTERERRLTALQRLAVVDAAAWWLSQDAGGELAYGLLGAAVENPLTAGYVYSALISRPGDPSATPAG